MYIRRTDVMVIMICESLKILVVLFRFPAGSFEQFLQKIRFLGRVLSSFDRGAFRHFVDAPTGQFRLL